MDYERIKKQCEAFAKRKGFPQDAEDFASETIIYLLEHPDCPELFIKHRFVDFLRKHYGRSGTPCGDAKQRARLGPGTNDLETVASDPPSGPSACKIEERVWRVSATEKQRYIAAECLVKERLGKDVAEEFGVTGCRISQVVSEMKRQLEDAIILDEYLPEYLDDEERQTLAIRWIEL